MIAKLTFHDLASIAPLPIVLIGAFLLLLMSTFFSSKKTVFLPATLFILIAAFISLFFHPREENPLLARWLCFDRAGQLFSALFLLIGFFSALLASPLLASVKEIGEYYFLLTSSIFGLLLIASSCDFLPLFLGIEALSISLYVLCGYIKGRTISHESALKYFLLGAFATAFLLYGIALIYGATGSTHLETLSYGYRQENHEGRILFVTGLVFVTVALGFKASLAPFHTVYPDVYQGAPLPVVAFMATGTKLGAFAALYRLFMEALPNFHTFWQEGAYLLVIPSLFIGNLGAIPQQDFSRFIAYTGISHAALMTLAVVAGGERGLHALLFYGATYLFATFGAFSIAAALFLEKGHVRLEDFRNLFRKSQFLSILMAFFLLSLAGLPPLAGFFAKFVLFKEAYEKGYLLLVVSGLMATLFSAYYYLRFIGLLFFDEGRDEEPLVMPRPLWIIALFSFLALLLFSLFPGFFLSGLLLEPFLKG